MGSIWLSRLFHYHPVHSWVMVGQSIVPRDQALDSELESGAHTTLILVATGLAFLFTTTAIIFYLFPVCRFMRRMLFPPPPVNGSSQAQNLESPNKKVIFRPTMTSTPLRQMLALHQPSYQPEQRTIPTPRTPVPLLPRPNASHDVLTSGFYNHRVSSLNQNHVNHYYPPHLGATLPPPLPTTHVTIISPHIAGWTKIADDVVGRHPFSKPLPERVASQAEIDLISDHIRIPWAYDARRSQPTPVKALGPAQDTQNRFGNLVLSASAGNTGGFLLRDQGLTAPDIFRASGLSPVMTRPQDQNTSRAN